MCLLQICFIWERGESMGCTYLIRGFRLSVGDVLLIKKFVIKSRYQALPQQKLEKAAKTQNLFNFDLNINSDNPPAEIIQVNPESVTDELELPQVVYTFVSRKIAGWENNDLL